jgi:hypothetical protein
MAIGRSTSVLDAGFRIAVEKVGTAENIEKLILTEETSAPVGRTSGAFTLL